MTDTPDKENRQAQFPWNDQGTYLYDNQLDFYSQQEAGAVLAALKAAGAKIDVLEGAEENPALWSASFLALPQPLDQFSRYLSIDVHPHKREAERIHCRFRLSQVPSPEPPKEYLEMTERVGGIAALSSRIAEMIPGPLADVRATLAYFISQKRWRSEIGGARRSRARTVSVDGKPHRLLPEAVVWKVDPPSGSIHRITMSLSDNKRFFGITVAARPKVEMTPRLLDDTEVAVWKGLEPFLTKEAA